MERIILLTILFTACTATAFGGEEFIFEKKISKNELREGDSVTVTIVIHNNGEGPLVGRLFDAYPTFLNAGDNLTFSKNSMGPVIYWDMTLGPVEKKEISYTLDAVNIPAAWNDKNVPIPKAWFIDAEGNRRDSIFQNDLLRVETALPETGCDYDFVCETERHEDHTNCPNDCGSSDLDLSCNDAENGICDPDCDKGVDPDCILEGGITTTLEKSISTTSLPTHETTSTSLAEAGDNSRKPESLIPYLLLALTIVLILIAMILKIRKKKEQRIVEEDRKYLEDLENETKREKEQAR